MIKNVFLSSRKVPIILVRS